MSENLPLLFIPTFNCAPQIGRVLEKVAPFQSLFKEILVVDNCSKDQTRENAKLKIRDLGLRNTSVVKNKENYGLGGSHKTAFEYGRKKDIKYCMILHGDDQADIKDFLSILKGQDYTNYDLVLGSRFDSASEISSYSQFRKIGNRGLNRLVSTLLSTKISDFGGSGLNVFRLKAFASGGEPGYLRFPNDLTFHTHIIFWAVQKNLKLLNVPISWRQEDQVSNVRLVRQTSKILMQLIRYRLRPDYLQNLPLNSEYSFEADRQIG